MIQSSRAGNQTMRRVSVDRRSISIRPALVLLLISVLFIPAYGFGDAESDSESRLINDVKYLASDELQGRGVGTQGLDKAAEYVRREFQKAGLNMKAVGGDAFHKFAMVTGAKLGEPNRLAFVAADGKTVSLKYDTDFRTCSFGGAGKLRGELVFCGYGIDAEDKQYQDFEGVDVKGKTIIMMRRTPQQENPHSEFGSLGRNSRHASLRTKISHATTRGAAAIIFVNDPYTIRDNAAKQNKRLEKARDAVVIAAEEFDAADENDSKKHDEARKKLSRTLRDLKNLKKNVETSNHDELMRFGYNGYGKEDTVPVLHITQSACDKLLKATLKKTLSNIEAEIDKTLKPQSVVLTGWTVNGETAVERVREEVKNVVGVIEAVGPLANETIVIGAHYDHLGLGKYGSLSPGVMEVHNGADDNGSGTAGLLELARRIAARKEKLPRRIVFIAFTAEELGLIGSARYVENPVFPLENTVAMFNMDMIGRMKNNKLTVFGSDTSPRWEKVVELYNEDSDLGLELTFKPEGFGPSDHSSFYGKKIPVLHFFTGTHNDYHRPSDDWEKINVNGMYRVVDLLEDIIVATAETKERPQYAAVKGRANIQRSGSRPYFGSIPDFSSEKEGYSISGVGPGSPAEKGGLKGGDSIIEFGKNKITDLSDFDLALRKFSSGDVVEVTVLRNKKKVKLKVTLANPK
jgi:hypothetical protein